MMFEPNVNMKMADLVEADYKLLGVLARMGIEGGFGEKSVAELCDENGLDAATFILICRAYSDLSYQPSDEILRHGHVGDVLRYLHQSHDYYINTALVSLASTIEKLIEPCSKPLQKAIWQFFSDYKSELEAHFQTEEDEVIPYVQKLLVGQRTPGFSIDSFEEAHTNVEEKISDLKNIIMKSLPKECDNRLRTTLLTFIYNLREDLLRHTRIEDSIMVPMVRLIEDPRSSRPSTEAENDGSEEREGLSSREKEILVSVAKGLLNKEIADLHNISINTVITHRKNITRKTGIKTVAGLTVYAILNGLIDINSVE